MAGRNGTGYGSTPPPGIPLLWGYVKSKQAEMCRIANNTRSGGGGTWARFLCLFSAREHA